MHITQEVQDLLRLHGELEEGVLLKKVYRFLSMGEQQFWEALKVLAKSGIIEVKGPRGGYTYKLKGK